MSNDAYKFLADLVLELIPLSTLASSALSINNGKTLPDWIAIILSFELSNPTILLKSWIKYQ